MKRLASGIVFFLILQGLTECRQQNVNVATTINDFGFKLFKEFNEDGNVFCPTLGVTTTLTAILQGAVGSTGDEIGQALGQDQNEQQTINYLHDVISLLRNNKSGYAFSNGIGVPSKSKVLPEFRSTLEDKLFIQLREQFTRDQIGIDSSVKFAAVWKYQFDKKRTKLEPFFVDNGMKTVHVPMMYIKGHFNYVYDLDIGAELVEIPLANDNLSMIIILPKKLNGIQDQKMYLEDHRVRYSFAGMGSCGIHLRIPKFSINTRESLVPALKRLGIQQAFTPSVADFSHVYGSPLYLSEANHKATIVVSEEGSMPAPPTDISDGLAPIDYDQPCMTYYTVDHPFHFLILYKPNNLILSIGQVMQP